MSRIMTIKKNVARRVNPIFTPLVLPPALCPMRLGLALAGLLFMASCATAPKPLPPLKNAYKRDFLIGVAINRRQYTGRDVRGDQIIKSNFDSISPENVLKWDSVHPKPDIYAFDGPDLYVKFGEDNHMVIVGHTLVWHAQTPRWVFQDTNGRPVDRERLLRRLHDHIQTVVGCYKGRIKIWDVVNEALNEDGTLRQSPWLKIIGEDYIAKAFQWAHEADPEAVLRYNDYGLEQGPKRRGAIALIRKLQAQGVPVTAIGLQGHGNLNWPTAATMDQTITELATLNLPVMITEMDIDCSLRGQRNTSADLAANARMQNENSSAAGGLPIEVQQKLADRYSELFGVFLKHKDVVRLVTLWGVTDADSWRMWGSPLLFDRSGRPKPAYAAVVRAAEQ